MNGTLANGGEDARYDALKRRFLTTLGIFGTVLLIAAVHAGYAVGYPGYYNPRTARDAGFHYGLRFDPTFHRDISIEELYEQLEWTKAHFIEQYDLNAVTWYLFKNAFELGFYEGWMQTDPDKTAKPGERIFIVD